MVVEPDYQYGADDFKVYEQSKMSSDKVPEVKFAELKKDGKSSLKEPVVDDEKRFCIVGIMYLMYKK